MKKIKLLLVLPLILLSLFLAKTSFAQTPQGNFPNNPFFNTSTPAVTSFIQYGEKTAKQINVPPFSTITVPSGSFSDNVTVYIFNGNWNKIKAVLPSGQSPISSYYIVFINSKGSMVLPTNQITIQSYNNYINTDTYFYPMGAVGSIDTANAKSWSGHILVNTPLPIQDSAFIVAVNKNLSQNDPSLNPNSNLGNGNTNSTPLPLNTQKAIAFVLLIGIALLLLFLMQKNKKTAHRRKH